MILWRRRALVNLAAPMARYRQALLAPERNLGESVARLFFASLVTFGILIGMVVGLVLAP